MKTSLGATWGVVALSVDFTRFHARQVCRNVGEFLLTNAEWEAAAAGRSNPGTEYSTDCKIIVDAEFGPVHTGSRSWPQSQCEVPNRAGTVGVVEISNLELASPRPMLQAS